MISVAMCTYNGEKFLGEQLESIFLQTCPPDEIIICDDNSQDNTVQVAKSLLNKWNGSWKLIQNKKNLGFRKNFEQAIQLCQGDIIFLSDQDDIWAPTKIETMMRTFQKRPNVILAFHDAEIVDKDLVRLAPSFWNVLNFIPECFWNFDYRQLLSHNVVQGSACAFRKNLVHCACPFPKEAVHDEWLALVALSMGDIWPINDKLLKYRQWGENAIGGGQITVIQKLKKYLFTIKKAVNMHRHYIFKKYSVNNEWINRYKGEIRITHPYMIRLNRIIDQRCYYIEQKDFKIISSWKRYFMLYPYTKSALKEFIKDVLSIIF